MTAALSLRMRLTLIILIPLLGISLLIGIWAVNDAYNRAGDRFDRSLLSAALAISRDVAVSGGDALSPDTNALLRDTSGGSVYYHVYAPDGVFITGYASPPVPPIDVYQIEDQQTYFDGDYLGRGVRVLRFRDAMQIDGLVGDFTFTVWQDTRLRAAIVRDLSQRTFGVMSSLVIALALIVWFGVRFGLSPLIGLQDAIAQRSSNDLSPIRRAVPQETKGIVGTLNHLLGQVSSTLQAKDDFISSAAHQLRNPIAGVVAMSEAVHSANTLSDMKERSADLVVASRHASDLANKLLAFERAKGLPPQGVLPQVDIVPLISDTVATLVPAAALRAVTLTFEAPPHSIDLPCDPLMLGEAITNLINNALAHGGDSLENINLNVQDDGDTVDLIVSDDGQGIAQANFELALERFGQIDPTGGSGLGLPIAKAVAEHHGGSLTLSDAVPGLRVAMRLLRRK